MASLQCPDCGSENAPGADSCSECGAALTTDARAGYQAPSYPPPPQARKGIAGWSTGKKVGVALVVLAALVIAGYIGFKAIKTITYPDLKLDTPPAGYQQVVEEQFEEIKKQFESTEEGGSLDAFYMVADGSEQIFIAHLSADGITLISFGGSDDPPETEDLSEMEDYVNRNRAMLQEELEREYSTASLDAETLVIEAVRLEKDGYCGIHVGANVPLGEEALLQDRILFFKDGITYVAAVQNVSGASNADKVQYLLQNLYFE